MNFQKPLSGVDPKLIKYGALAGGVGLLALLAPVLKLAAQAGLSLVAIAICGIVLFALIQALPLLGQKWENYLLAMRKKEAAENPIEQLQNGILSKGKEIQAYNQAMGQIFAQIQGLTTRLRERKKTHPNGDYTAEESSLRNMVAFYEGGIRKGKMAQEQHELYKQKVEEKIFKWDFAKAGRQALGAIDEATQKSILRDLLEDTSFKAVEDEFNQVFASLAIEANMLSSSPQLGFGGSVSLDTSSINLPNYTRVQ
jgi:hypothetical protein